MNERLVPIGLTRDEAERILAWRKFLQVLSEEGFRLAHDELISKMEYVIAEHERLGDLPKELC